MKRLALAAGKVTFTGLAKRTAKYSAFSGILSLAMVMVMVSFTLFAPAGQLKVRLAGIVKSVPLVAVLPGISSISTAAGLAIPPTMFATIFSSSCCSFTATALPTKLMMPFVGVTTGAGYTPGVALTVPPAGAGFTSFTGTIQFAPTLLSRVAAVSS
ncbi:hypothetical protein D3C86_1554530 [compost metagenome]